MKNEKPIGFILYNPPILGKFRNLRKNTFEPYTTGEFLNYPEHWKPVYEKPQHEVGMCYIQNTNAGFLGNAPIFWGKDRRGYTAYLENAHKFTLSEAKEICLNNPEKNKAWDCEYIDSLAKKVVDDQHLEREKEVKF